MSQETAHPIYAIARGANIGLTFLGALIFGALLYAVKIDPSVVENRGRSFLAAEIAQSAESARETMLRLGRAAPLSPKIDAVALAEAEAAVDAIILRFVDTIAAGGCPINCATIQALRAVLAEQFALEGTRAELALGFLRGWATDAYTERRDALQRDVAIVLGCNFAVMILALALAIFRARAAFHLLPISVLLFTTTILGSSWYLFGQNWVLTILYSSYVGWGYLAVLACVFLLLLDIVFNRARVITWAINQTLESLLRLPAQLQIC